MTQPQFSEGPPVPLMTEGVLDLASLKQLLADLRDHTTVLGAREKSAPASLAEPYEQQLDRLSERIMTGEVRSIQIRYRYDGREWTDTIMKAPGGHRIVRCQH